MCWCPLNQIGSADPEPLEPFQCDASGLKILGCKSGLRQHFAVTAVHLVQGVPQLGAFFGEPNVDRAAVVYRPLVSEIPVFDHFS